MTCTRYTLSSRIQVQALWQGGLRSWRGGVWLSGGVGWQWKGWYSCSERPDTPNAWTWPTIQSHKSARKFCFAAVDASGRWLVNDENRGFTCPVWWAATSCWCSWESWPVCCGKCPIPPKSCQRKQTSLAMKNGVLCVQHRERRFRLCGLNHTRCFSVKPLVVGVKCTNHQFRTKKKFLGTTIDRSLFLRQLHFDTVGCVSLVGQQQIRRGEWNLDVTQKEGNTPDATKFFRKFRQFIVWEIEFLQQLLVEDFVGHVLQFQVGQSQARDTGDEVYARHAGEEGAFVVLGIHVQWVSWKNVKIVQKHGFFSADLMQSETAAIQEFSWKKRKFDLCILEQSFWWKIGKWLLPHTSLSFRSVFCK